MLSPSLSAGLEGNQQTNLKTRRQMGWLWDLQILEIEERNGARARERTFKEGLRDVTIWGYIPRRGTGEGKAQHEGELAAFKEQARLCDCKVQTRGGSRLRGIRGLEVWEAMIKGAFYSKCVF